MLAMYMACRVFGVGGTVLTSYARLSLHPDLLNVRYVVKPASVADPAPIYQDARWKVYRNLNAYPRAWLVRKTIVETSQEAVFRRLGDPAINLHDVALLETPLPQAFQQTTFQQTKAANEEIRFISYEADRMAVE